jgi:hypothetical protein
LLIDADVADAVDRGLRAQLCGGPGDLEDIRALIRANRDTLNLTEVREYFALFNRAQLLEEILIELK